MKTIVILFCLFAGNGMLTAATQTAANQDKPSRLYLSQYTEHRSGNVTVAEVNPTLYQTDTFSLAENYEEHVTYRDNAKSSASFQYHFTAADADTYFNYDGSTAACYNANWLWNDSLNYASDAGMFPGSVRTIQTAVGADNYSGNDNNYNTGYATNWNITTPFQYSETNQGMPVYNEYCDLKVPLLDHTSYFAQTNNLNPFLLFTSRVKESASRIARAQWRLQVGGKFLSKHRRAFKLVASAMSCQSISDADYMDGEGGLGMPYWGSFITAFEAFNGRNSGTDISPQSIIIGRLDDILFQHVVTNHYALEKVVYASFPENANVDVTPYVAGNDSYFFEINYSDLTKSNWQKVVQNEINSDSGVAIENYAASNGFMANRTNIQAVYAFYQKVFTEQPTWYYWAGLAKLAGAPVYAGLSDAQYAVEGFISTGYLTLDQYQVSMLPFYLALKAAQFQTNLIAMNIDVYDDIAWQFEAYRKGGLHALEYVNANEPGIFSIAPWRLIDQAIQQNNITNIQAGNQQLLQREQQQILAQGYSALGDIFPGTTSLMSILAQNPVLGGPSFATLEPNKNLASYPDRWDWITRPYTSPANSGMLPLWLHESYSTRLSDVGQPLLTRALQFSFVYAMNNAWTLR